MKRQTSTRTIPSLSQIVPFDVLDEARLHRLVAASRLVRAERGEVLIQADEISTCVHVVLDGEVRCLLLAPSGNEKLIRIAGSGEIFGEEAALLGRPAMAMAMAARNTRLLHVPVALVREAMATVPSFAEAMTTRLAAASYEMMLHMQLCIQLSSTQRVAQYLSQLAPEGVEQAEIHLASDKQTIAAQLNLTPETFSRVLSRFVRDGLVTPHGRRGLVLDNLPQLRRAASQ
ncbi:MAG TPA: Crp/Fnr family transcriptional regulator [Thauera sp.]|nr:Crp/Fnr family transcriptional regulator [Thauera sp.]HRA80900.1 Crp/Fnr family transcriptional regulator [Thauera sp.]